MKTAVAALFLCLAASAAQAQTTNHCERLTQAVEPANRAIEEFNRDLQSIDYEGLSLALRPNDRRITEELSQEQRQLDWALRQFINKQNEFLGALRRCS